jgi:hypothetical protein
MTTASFEIHVGVGSEVETLDEAAIEQRLAAATSDLIDLDTIVGAVVIVGDDGERASIVDDLGSAAQRLCFDAVSALSSAAATRYSYRYLISDTTVLLTPTRTADATTVAITGDAVGTRTYDADPLLLALLDCGRRYLGFLERVGGLGREASAVELAHLRPFADRATEALRRRGLLS